MRKVVSFFTIFVLAVGSFGCGGNKAEADKTQHLISNDDKRSGLQHYQQRMKFNNAKAKQLCDKGIALYEKKKFPGAKQNLLKALELEPTNAVVLTNLGHIAYETGNFKDAIDFYNRSHIIFDSNQLNAGVHLGRSYYLNGEYDKCIIISKYTVAHAEDEKSYYLSYYNMTKALIKQGDCEAAKRSFKNTQPALNSFKSLKSRIYVLEHELENCNQK
ncbi:MAG: tetratricopeptide repeat protein [Flavobacterium sp.]|uniref:tetratricopeptide repeat protein n=1 Tax=Flavobacterium sp. TaxID=239 RepID=UPI00120E54ED|nr:tetratricopeptide repeat protein [Flavobacterium sp.]RZJ65244.1 MAG: tetratricopeptide repeat protein [Flavobacterium sp.]